MQRNRFVWSNVCSLVLATSCGGISTKQTSHRDGANRDAGATAHASDSTRNDASAGSGLADAATGGNSVSDGGPSVGDAAPFFSEPPRDPEDYCAAWQADLMAENLRAVERFGLSWAESV
jgi:hypothetical protein